MFEEDWDDDPVTTKPVHAPVQGRMFGMRGRGFKPIEAFDEFPRGRKYNCEDKENSSNKYSENSVEKDYKRNNGLDRDNDKCKWRESRRKDDEYKDDQNVSGVINKKKSTVKYIPKEIFEDEELFSGGIRTGINFSKYDDIDVKVSGKDIPKKINDFANAGLCELLLRNIKKCSYKKPTPIQKHSLPIVMNGRDMMACAQTGSGKTAAFLIPILNCLLEKEPGPIGDGRSTPQFIVVTPTRELAIQIYVETKKFTYGSKLKTEIAYGGTSLRYQLQRVKCGCNILIGTPGRLKDFINRGAVVLSEVLHFVIDEADELLDRNFLVDIQDFLSHPTMNKAENVQILMFSATFPEKIQKLASTFLKNYLFLTVGIIGGACTDVEQKFYLLSKHEKRSKLIELLKENGSGKTLIFVGQKRAADMIATFLSEKDFPATSMHGDRDQMLREEALNDFKSGKMDLLVATAVAARGLDIQNVAHVINFDLPASIDEYVHRIGRTGRVGNRGLSSSFYDPRTDSHLAPALVKILSQAQQEVPEFLQTSAAGQSLSDAPNNFGGKDIRKRGGVNRDRDEVSRPLESVPTYEEEVW